MAQSQVSKKWNEWMPVPKESDPITIIRLYTYTQLSWEQSYNSPKKQ